jgi:hypothetical protein
MGFRPLSRKDAKLNEHYGDLVKIFPKAEFVVDQDGTYRFKPDPLLSHLVNTGQVSMNRLWADSVGLPPPYMIDDLVRFYQNIGYSLGGFLEVFEHRLASLKALAQGPDMTHTGLIPTKIGGGKE